MLGQQPAVATPCEDRSGAGNMPRMPPVDFRRLARLALFYVAIWCVIAIYSTSEFQRRGIALSGFRLGTDEVLFYQLAAAIIWACFTPLIVAVAERLRFRQHKVRDTAICVLAVPVLAIARAVIGAAAQSFVEDGRLVVPFLELSVGIRLHQNIFRILVIFAITWLVMAWREAAAREAETSELERALAEVHLDELRARLQPDFLVSALKTVGDRIRERAPNADALLIGLGDLLRWTLQLGRQERVVLADELEFLDRYLEYQRMLSGAEVSARFEIDEELLSVEVPLMLLQPLVDEALASLKEDRGGIDLVIRAWRDDGKLVLEVRDDSVRTRVRAAAEVIRSRLLRYSGDAAIEQRIAGRSLLTRIELPSPGGQQA